MSRMYRTARGKQVDYVLAPFAKQEATEVEIAIKESHDAALSFVKDGITSWINNWKSNDWLTSSKKPVKNQDLWKELDLLNNKYEIVI